MRLWVQIPPPQLAPTPISAMNVVNSQTEGETDTRLYSWIITGLCEDWCGGACRGSSVVELAPEERGVDSSILSLGISKASKYFEAFDLFKYKNPSNFTGIDVA